MSKSNMEFMFLFSSPNLSVQWVVSIAGMPAGVSNHLTSLGHTGRRRDVLGHTLNTQTLMKTDEQKKKGFK